MKTDLTLIAVVLDRSGSMSRVADDTIGGFNKFLADQKNVPGLVTVTLAQFDNEYEIVHDAKPIKEVPDLNRTTFVPRGSTALLDAIGRTINRTGSAMSAMAEEQRPGKMLFIIITDGEENSSKEFSQEKVFEMISHQRDKYQWEFIFLGANQDAIATATKMGMSAGSSMTYASNKDGTASAFASLNATTRSYRGGGSAAFTSADRDAQKKAGASS